jgi:peptide deformylase
MKLKLLKDSQLPLGIKAKPVETIDKFAKELAINMMAIMKFNNGIGLAAPQVGHNLQIITFDVGYDFGYIFNPVIMNQSTSLTQAAEGCLSYPKKKANVKRSREVLLKYIDLAGNIVVKPYTGITARVILHEYDHLQGINMFQREEADEAT